MCTVCSSQPHTAYRNTYIYRLNFGKDQDVAFDIIYVYIYLIPSKMYYWFKKWLKQLQMTSITTKNWKYCGNMFLLTLQMLKHVNYIYFMHDILVCFPKPGHIIM